METILEEIRSALDEREISPSIATRLILKALMASLAAQKATNLEVKKIAENPLVKIGFWAQQNPRAMITSLIIFISVIVIPHWLELNTVVYALIVKYLGIPLQ